MSVQADLLPTHTKKTVGAMKAERTVKRITFDPAEASPEATLHVRVPKLNENEILVPDSLALVFAIDLAGGHANSFLVKNVSRALVVRMVLNSRGRFCREDLYLSQEERDNMYREGIQSEAISKIHSDAGDKPTSDAKNTKLEGIYGKK